jgi:predicted permease
MLPGGRGSLRHAARALRRSPWYATSVVLVVACTLAIATTTFAVVDGVLFKSLPYDDAHEIVALQGTFDQPTEASVRLASSASPAEVNTWRQVLTDVPITLIGSTSIDLEDGSFATVARADRQFFELFGLEMAAGGFDDRHYDRNASPIPIVVSHALWLEKFGGDPAALGRTFSPPSTFPPGPLPVYVVVGVLAPDALVPPLLGFDGNNLREVDVLMAGQENPEFTERVGVAFARVSPDQRPAVRAALGVAAGNYKAARLASIPAESRERRAARLADGVELTPIGVLLTERQRPILTVAFATAAALTLLVLLNAGALATARAHRRLREMALRRSLGARASDLFRLALVEQALLVSAGAALGLATAPFLVYLVVDRLPSGLHLLKEPRLDWRVAAFAVGIAGVMAAAIAALSVRQVVRQASPAVLLARAHGGGPGQVRTGRWLVAAQVCVAFGLVLGGVMFIASLGLVWQEDLGFRTRDAAVVGVSFRPVGDPVRAHDLARELRAMPGVIAVGPFSGELLRNTLPESFEFRDPQGRYPEEPPGLLRAGAGFFAAAGIEPLQGRLPTDAELEAGAPVIVVSESLARRYWPDAPAIGQTLNAVNRPQTVIGIVRDIRVEAWDLATNGMIFSPLALFNRTFPGASLFLQLDPSRPAAAADVAGRIRRADPGAFVREYQTVDGLLSQSIQPRRISALAAGAFGIGAVALVAIGLFGLVAQSVGWREREMGIRLALGEMPSSVVRRVMAEPLVAVVGGLVAGGLVASAMARFVASYLYTVTPYDIRLWGFAALLMLFVAVLGAIIPALRAGRVDPLAVLRSE